MDKTKKPKTLVPIWTKITPSLAVEAAINGLQEITKLPNFILNMGTYGSTQLGMCHGCAATCATYYLVGEKPTVGNISQSQRPVNGFTHKSIIQFESAIDDLRGGYIATFLANFPDIEYSTASALEDAAYEKYGYGFLIQVKLIDFPRKSEVKAFIREATNLYEFLKEKEL